MNLKPNIYRLTPEKIRSACWLTLALMLFLVSSFAESSWSYSGSIPETTGPETADPKAATAGSLYLKDSEGTVRQAVHIQSAVAMNVKGMTNSVTVSQQFTNTSDQWVEGIYVFPLPDDSAVNFMRMTIGERTIVGKIKERSEAKKIYQQAKAAGKKTALVEQDRPNIFTQSVANVGPGETISIELRYLQAVRYDSGRFSLRFPMTLTPRYIPGAPLKNSEVGATYASYATTTRYGWAQATTEVPDAFRITPKYLPTDSGRVNAIQISIRLEAGLPLADIHSDSHMLDINQVRSGQDYVHEIRFALPSVPMDRDFELEWTPETGSAPAAAIFHEQVDAESYVQLMLLPPQPGKNITPLPRELILIIDTSGSMAGPSIVQAKKSVELALRRLTPRDRFNIIEFNSDYSVLFNSPVVADGHNIQEALDFVGQLYADGGTNIAPALHEALQTPPDEYYLKQIVFITDGSVGNEAALFSVIQYKLGPARLFTVGIGSAPNSFFMRKAAQFGRGTFTHIGTVEQVGERMRDLFNKLERPAVASLQIDWPGNAEVETYPARIPDLYFGEPLFVTARLNPAIDRFDTLRVSGHLNGQQWENHINVPTAGVFSTPDDVSETPRQSGLATLWARQKIAALLDQKIAGKNPQQVRTEVLKVALAHQLMSPYTSFVAVEKSPSRPPRETLENDAILNHLPHGQSAPPVMYPNTATPATLHFLIGLMMLVLAVFIRGQRIFPRG